MNKEMHVPLLDSARNTFLEQMIPHHLNAVNMAKLLMKTDLDSVAATDGLEDILWDIVNVQNYQVHQFRNYLEANTGNAGIASDDSGLSAGALAGIVIGVAVGVMLIGGAAFFVKMQKEKKMVSPT